MSGITDTNETVIYFSHVRRVQISLYILDISQQMFKSI